MKRHKMDGSILEAESSRQLEDMGVLVLKPLEDITGGSELEAESSRQLEDMGVLVLKPRRQSCESRRQTISSISRPRFREI
jgi:hypothetical protein